MTITNPAQESAQEPVANAAASTPHVDGVAAKNAASASVKKPAAAKANASVTKAAAVTAAKPAAAKKVPAAAKPVEVIKPAAAKKPAAPKAAAKKPEAKAAKPAKAKAAPAEKAAPVKEKAKKAKLVRDSFSMPEGEYAVLGAVKKACLKAGIDVKKSELLRIGVALIQKMDVSALKGVLATLQPLKAGRPKQEK